MKKIVVLGLVIALFTVTASAQKGFDRSKKRDFSTHHMTRGDKHKMHKKSAQYKKMEKRFKRDGKITPSERRQLHKMKMHDRREAYRFKHNGRKRS